MDYEHRTRRIVCVDDDEDFLAILALLLEDERYVVETYLGAVEALARARRPPTVDAFVVDYSLPTRNGADVVKALRSSGFESPVVVITALDPRCVDLSAPFIDRVVRKPFAMEALVVALERAMRGTAPSRRPPAATDAA